MYGKTKLCTESEYFSSTISKEREATTYPFSIDAGYGNTELSPAAVQAI